MALADPAAPTVSVSSFHYVAPYPNRVAELCGKVVGAFTPQHRVMIKVDPTTNGPGYYSALPAPEGGFCALLYTSSGKADVALSTGVPGEALRYSGYLLK